MSKISVLDHGYVELIESWGSDERIIEAARMSTAKGFLGWGNVDPCPSCEANALLSVRDNLYIDYERAKQGAACNTCHGSGKKPGDEKLLRFLWTEGHVTPFEMAGMTIEVQLPIFVTREWHRHRTQGYSEQSARYVEMPELAYIPSTDRLMTAGQSASNKQASGAGLSEGVAANTAFVMQEVYNVAYAAYHALLAQGVAREVARIVLPVGQYTRMRVTANLRNWLHFLKLRMASNAQWEIRQYANVVGLLVGQTFPRTWGLFKEGLQR